MPIFKTKKWKFRFLGQLVSPITKTLSWKSGSAPALYSASRHPQKWRHEEPPLWKFPTLQKQQGNWQKKKKKAQINFWGTLKLTKDLKKFGKCLSRKRQNVGKNNKPPVTLTRPTHPPSSPGCSTLANQQQAFMGGAAWRPPEGMKWVCSSSAVSIPENYRHITRPVAVFI